MRKDQGKAIENRRKAGAGVGSAGIPFERMLSAKEVQRV